MIKLCLILLTISFFPAITNATSPALHDNCEPFLRPIRPDLNTDGRRIEQVLRPPKVLFRISDEAPRFGAAGFLVANSQKALSEEWTVPMASEADIDKMIRYFLAAKLEAREIFIRMPGIFGKPSDISQVFLLEVDPSAVEGLSASYHKNLDDREYFGLVPRKAVLNIRRVVFEESNESIDYRSYKYFHPDVQKDYVKTQRWRYQIEVIRSEH